MGLVGRVGVRNMQRQMTAGFRIAPVDLVLPFRRALISLLLLVAEWSATQGDMIGLENLVSLEQGEFALGLVDKNFIGFHALGQWLVRPESQGQHAKNAKQGQGAK